MHVTILWLLLFRHRKSPAYWGGPRFRQAPGCCRASSITSRDWCFVGLEHDAFCSHVVRLDCRRITGGNCVFVCVCGGQDSGSTAWDSDVTKPITLRRGSGAVTVYVDESTTPTVLILHPAVLVHAVWVPVQCVCVPAVCQCDRHAVI